MVNTIITVTEKENLAQYETNENTINEASSDSDLDVTDHIETFEKTNYKRRMYTPMEPKFDPTFTERLLASIEKRAPARVIRRIFKCTLAFFFATLFSTIRPIAKGVGPASHIVAVGCLLSHPGRTVGAQLDASLTSALGAGVAILYGLAAVAAIVAYRTHYPNSEASSAINCSCLVIGIFFAQVLRQRFPKLFYFSLQFMIVILFTMTNAIGDMENPYLLSFQFGLPFLIGAFVSLFVNLVFWPETAVDGLGRTLRTTLFDTKQLLDIMTKQFFLDSKETPIIKINELVEKMRQDMTKVNNAYQEAKYEVSYAFSSSSELNPIRELLNIVTKHLIILSDSLKSEQMMFNFDNDAQVQVQEPLKQTQDRINITFKLPTRTEEDDSGEELNIRSFASKAPDSYMKKGSYVSSGTKTPEKTDEQKKKNHRSIMSVFSLSHSDDEGRTSKDEDHQNTVNSFKSFISLPPLPKPPQKPEKVIGTQEKKILLSYLERLRDPLLNLALECGTVLDCVRDSLGDQLELSDDDDQTHSHIGSYLLYLLKLQPKRKSRKLSFLCSCAETMKSRLEEFDLEEKQRMKTLHQINNQLEIRDELFMVFFFIFTLREIASNLGRMAAEIRRIQQDQRTRKRWHMPQITIQHWRKWFYASSYQNVQDRGGYTFQDLSSNMNENQRDLEDEFQLARISTQHRLNDQTLGDVEATEFPRKRMGSFVAELPPDDASLLIELESGPDLMVDEAKVPFFLRFRYKLWLALRYFQGYDFKFALKFAVTAGLLTIPEWLPNASGWFSSIKGPWAALTVISIMSPTSGGTLSAGLWRLISTIIGAGAAWAVLEMDKKNGVLISGFAFILALPLFYVHFSTSYSKVTIITLVTFVVIAISQTNATDTSQPVFTIVWQRTLTLIVGLLAALLLSWGIWPFVAREAVRKSLAGTVSDLGDYYSYIMGTFLYHDEGIYPTKDEFQEAEKMETKLQKMLTTCHLLLELTDHEPRIKGPFPKEFYKEILISANNLLDRMVSLRIILLKMPPDVKKTVRSLDKNLYRRDMVASILLHFYTLSASLSYKIPLPSFMPSARSARTRVLRHRRQQEKPERMLRYKNLTWFAMGCSTEDIIGELEHLTNLVRFIVGDSKFTKKARRIEKKTKTF